MPLSTKGSVLVADDEPGIRTLIAEILTFEGYSVITAEDGKSALSLARKYNGRLDLLITDVLMPGVDGFDLREKLLRERPGIKILVVSGNLDPEIGGEDFKVLRKPFQPGELVTGVKELLTS